MCLTNLPQITAKETPVILYSVSSSNQKERGLQVQLQDIIKILNLQYLNIVSISEITDNTVYIIAEPNEHVHEFHDKIRNYLSYNLYTN